MLQNTRILKFYFKFLSNVILYHSCKLFQICFPSWRSIDSMISIIGFTDHSIFTHIVLPALIHTYAIDTDMILVRFQRQLIHQADRRDNNSPL